jgi:predicted DNA-binding ribbon-helix-helix protein
MKSAILKHSIAINDRKTSVSLEDQFWDGLKEIAAIRRQTVSSLVGSIALNVGEAHNLSSAIRQFVFAYYRSPPQINV